MQSPKSVSYTHLYMDELAGWQNGYDSKVGPKLVKEMIERDVNHPSIIDVYKRQGVWAVFGNH